MSKKRYRAFVQDYKQRRIDQATDRQGDIPSADGRERRRSRRKKFLRMYLQWLWPHRFRVATLLLLAASVAGLQMLQPLFMRYMIDRILLGQTLSAAAKLQALNLAGTVFLAVIIVAALLNVVKDYQHRLLNVKVMLALRNALFERFLHLPLTKLWDMKTGGILSRLNGDVDITTGLLQMAVVSPTLSLLRLIIGVGILLSLNWRLAVAGMAILPGAMLMSFAFSRRIRPIYRSVRRDVELIDGRVGETFSGIRTVRAFRQETGELLDYIVGRHSVLRKELFAHRRELVLWTAWGLFISIVNVVIVWFGSRLNLDGAASIGDIMAFQWYSFLLLSPVWSIASTFSELQRSLAAVERVFEILEMPRDKPDRPDAKDAPAIVNELRFEHVEFEYREGLPVVKDLHVTVPGGTTVALVGRSGTGKTTVTDIVARFHDPTRGRMLLNGEDVREFRLSTYRQLLGMVHQDVFLFDGTVRENIAYGRHSATEADVQDAARRANALEFIEKLPFGYETIVGERGVKLSGGQRQRLAIARAILARPQILILDEATSNLDSESERLIQASMIELLAGRTTFVIAHRLSTVRRADMILLLDDGRVVERGTHDQLMAARGMYHEMVSRQMQSHALCVGNVRLPPEPSM